VAASGAVPVEESPKPIIQGGKKSIRGLIIAFIYIRPVIGFSREIRREETGEFRGIIAELK